VPVATPPANPRGSVVEPPTDTLDMDGGCRELSNICGTPGGGGGSFPQLPTYVLRLTLLGKCIQGYCDIRGVYLAAVAAFRSCFCSFLAGFELGPLLRWGFCWSPIIRLP